MNLSPAWRARLPVLAVLGILLAGNPAVLVGYRLSYEERFLGLQQAGDFNKIGSGNTGEIHW